MLTISKLAIAATLSLGVALTSQATVTDLGTVLTTTTKGTDTTDGSFMDFFNFTVGANGGSILASSSNLFSSYGVSLSSLALYVGTYASTSAISGLTAVASSTTPMVSDQGAGASIYTVGTGTYALDPSATYTLAVAGTSIGDSRYTTNITLAPLAAVPEPGTYAMLLAGLGIMGFVAKRRNKNS